jgi:hypothetical protein
VLIRKRIPISDLRAGRAARDKNNEPPEAINVRPALLRAMHTARKGMKCICARGAEIMADLRA